MEAAFALVLYAAIPVVVALLPGRRSWLLAITLFAVWVWFTWPTCEIGPGNKCIVGIQIASFIAFVGGGALLARGGQLFFSPLQWWVRAILCAVGMLAGYTLYGTIFFR